MSSAKLDPIQRAAVLTAMQKQVKSALDSAREEADGELCQMNEAMGVDKVTVKIGDAEVGTFSVKYSKEGWAFTDMEAFQEFALTYGFAHERRSIRPEYMELAIELVSRECPEAVATDVEVDKGWEKLIAEVGGVPCYLDSGEAVPGIAKVPRGLAGSMLRGCEPEKVMPALAGVLGPAGIAALLEGGSDE